jgi:hypothetical protein
MAVILPRQPRTIKRMTGEIPQSPTNLAPCRRGRYTGHHHQREATHPYLPRVLRVMALVDQASDLDALLEDHGASGRLPAGLVGALRLDLQRALDRPLHHHRRLRATAPAPQR